MIKSLQREVDEFFQELWGNPVAETVVSASAVCQARQKLRHTAFMEAMRFVADAAYSESDVELPGGFRIVAVDGTKVNLPDTPEIRSRFGPDRKRPGREGPPQALISTCCDVYNGLVLDVEVASCDGSERDLLRKHLRNLDDVIEEVILLLDRGYWGYYWFREILASGAHFVCRVPVNASCAIRDFVRSGKRDAVIELHPDAKARKQCEAAGLPTGPLRVRAVRVDLKHGEPEVLVSSLIEYDLPVEFFAGLYSDRWESEETYKLVKAPLDIERFSGKSVETVLQDVYSRMFLLNLTAVINLSLREAVNSRCAARKYQYHVNVTTALSKVRGCLAHLLLGLDPLRVLKALCNTLLRNLLPYRPGRSWPRPKRAGPRRAYGVYKPI